MSNLQVNTHFSHQLPSQAHTPQSCSSDPHTPLAICLDKNDPSSLPTPTTEPHFSPNLGSLVQRDSSRARQFSSPPLPSSLERRGSQSFRSNSRSNLFSQNGPRKYTQEEIEKEQAARDILQVPEYSLPGLGVFAFLLFFWAHTLYHAISAPSIFVVWGMFLNTFFMYGIFFVLHEAVHNNLSKHRWINEVVGRISIFVLSPIANYPGYRAVHGAHHKYTNTNKDPSCFTRPLPSHLMKTLWNWFTIDVFYWRCYLREVFRRSFLEQFEFCVSGFVSAFLLYFSFFVASSSVLKAFLFCWLIPSRLVIPIIVLVFNYLPHSDYQTYNSVQETRVYVFANPILNAVLSAVTFCSNFHLIHHLHPQLPFFSLPAMWELRELNLRSKGALVSTL
eukprot:GCRY01005772.1.p1 GENE.GCRY01005772.1~~GCRY01005772.1.p1  ORF type:complete len:391 (+),score=55.88 GCRY01005772.1:195-1367(+)